VERGALIVVSDAGLLAGLAFSLVPLDRSASLGFDERLPKEPNDRKKKTITTIQNTTPPPMAA
jgi:hypothetical protein